MEKQIAEFRIQDMIGIGIMLVVIGLVFVYGLNTMSSVKDDMTAGTAERNASEAGIKGIAKIPEKLPLIATIIVAVIVIGIIVRYLGNMYSSK